MKTNSYACDVCVAGGGLSGVAAAVAAAREGCNVLLIEESACLGGAASNNLISPFVKYWTEDEKGNRVTLNRGFFEEIINALSELGGIDGNDKVLFHEEYLKLVLDRLARKNGVRVLFHTSVTDARRTENGIDEIEIFNVNGKGNVKAKFYIDATGDADIVRAAGYPYFTGRPSDNACQPMTLCFNIGNVHFGNMTHFEVRKHVNALYKEWQNLGKIRNPRENVLIFSSPHPNTLHFNSTRIIGKNPLNAEDLSLAESEAREQMFELFFFLKENFEMFKDSYIVNAASSIGVRESARICGLYTLTESDVLNCTKFYDSVARSNYPVDIHDPSGGGTVLKKIPRGEYYTVPYRALIPCGSTDLLTCGRSVSAEHEAQASVRVMPVVCCIGESAGLAAALAVSDKCAAEKINIEKLHTLQNKYNVLY